MCCQRPENITHTGTIDRQAEGSASGRAERAVRAQSKHRPSLSASTHLSSGELRMAIWGHKLPIAFAGADF